MTATHDKIEVRRGIDRGRTQIGWLDSAHSFSFGQYDDAQRRGYRSLRVLNDDRIAPGSGFGEHGHDNMEIISWVVDGALRHGDSLENSRQLSPGEVQVMSAGTGIRHSEFNASATEPAHFLQVWIQPKSQGVAPRYDQARIDSSALHNAFAPIASGREADIRAGVLPIDQDAVVLIADIDANASATYTFAQGRYAYVHVVTGDVTIAGQSLHAGDAALIELPGEVAVVGSVAAQVMLFDLA